MLTADLDNPFGYGRILRSSDRVVGIVEEKDATPQQREIGEINSGMYAFDGAALLDAITGLNTSNSQGEEYLTDVIEILASRGDVVIGVGAHDTSDILGINDRSQLAAAMAIMRDRINDKWMKAGVTMLDPESTWIDVDAELAPRCNVYSHRLLCAGRPPLKLALR